MNTSRQRYRGDFLSEHFALEPAKLPEGDSGLSLYLKYAKLTINEFTEPSDSPLQVQLAHFPQSTFAMVTTPPVRVTWQRTSTSRGRGLLLLARQGAFEVTGGGGVITRGATAAVITPGTDTIGIRTMGPRTEVIYVSVAASALTRTLSSLQERIVLPAVAWGEVAPLYMFVRALVDPGPTGPRDPRALLAVPAEDISRALVLALAGEAVSDRGLIDRLRDYLDENFADHAVSVGSASAALTTAPRTLQAALSAASTTFTNELRLRRVAELRRLQEVSPDVRQVDLASEAGFSSISAMYRALRAAGALDRRLLVQSET